MNFFNVGEQLLIIKELSTTEQEYLNKLKKEDLLEDKKFNIIVEKYIDNKEDIDFKNINDEMKIDIIQTITEESDIKKYGYFDIIKTFDKILGEDNKVFFLIAKELKEFGYKYIELKQMSQQLLIETLIFEMINEHKIKELADILKELNLVFKNDEIKTIIEELTKMYSNNKTTQNQNINTGVSGLAQMK